MPTVVFADMPEDLIRELRKDRRISSVERDSPVEVQDWHVLRPDDVGALEQVIVDGPQSLRFMNAMGLGALGVRIAVVDTGVNEGPFNLLASRSFVPKEGISDEHGHGTAMASLASMPPQRTPVGTMQGVVSDALLINAKVLDKDGGGLLSDVVRGVEWAVLDQRADVVNLSLGGPATSESDVLVDAIAKLSEQAVFVVAAGNSGPGPGSVNTPGISPQAITVGSVSATIKPGEPALFSSRGPVFNRVKPDISAPGGFVGRLNEGEVILARGAGRADPQRQGWMLGKGTSQATARMSGVVASYLSKNRTASATGVKGVLEKVGGAKDNFTGWGRVNARRMFEFNPGVPVTPVEGTPIPLLVTLGFMGLIGGAVVVARSARRTRG